MCVEGAVGPRRNQQRTGHPPTRASSRLSVNQMGVAKTMASGIPLWLQGGVKDRLPPKFLTELKNCPTRPVSKRAVPRSPRDEIGNGAGGSLRYTGSECTTPVPVVGHWLPTSEKGEIRSVKTPIHGLPDLRTSGQYCSQSDTEAEAWHDEL
jgi:hypothetical protein